MFVKKVLFGDLFLYDGLEKYKAYKVFKDSFAYAFIEFDLIFVGMIGL